MIGLMADLVDNQGKTHAEAAAGFIAEYRDTLDLWKN
jgi:ABC-type proline/glycine betaine transport system substrate-binding protein